MTLKNILRPKRLLLVFSLIFFFVATLFSASSQTVYAANIGVNTFGDELNANGNCSLREAIQAANTDTAVDACVSGSGPDTIVLAAGTYTLSIVGAGEDANATGDLDIIGNLAINGAGNTTTRIDGADIDRVFEVRPGATVVVDAVSVQNGKPNASGGGILNRDKLTLTKSTVTSNTGLNFGGGIFNAGTLTITNSTVSNNETIGLNLSGGGGGIFTEGTLTMTGSTVNDNTTLGRGGGIYNLDQTATITNSTISTNTGLNGGGIFNRSGTINLTQVTLTGNMATDNAGGVWNFAGTIALANTIIAGNTAATPADDCAGGMTSLGYNLASDATCALGGAGDLNSTNPLLAPLANNGGSTMTHALLLGSPALDVVAFASCTVITDQRGVLRPQGPACDIGAFELEPTLPAECDGEISDYNLIQGTNANDTLIGTSGKDLIFGYAGNDKIKGKSADDCLIGGPGNDEIDAGSGRDVLLAGEGNDELSGGSGNDHLDGGGGDDDMKGGSGSDTIDGQAGANDKANGGTGIDTCSAETETNCEI